MLRFGSSVNPDGYASDTDGSYGCTFSREIASGRLEILPEDWATLGVVVGGVFQLVPTFTEAPATPVHPFMMGG
jgi:Phage protein Gp19/Gp15/Gp42